MILFGSMAVAPPTAGSPTPPADPYLRCTSPGVADRLDGASQSPNMILHLADGGTVYFQSQGTNVWRVSSITDPYNQATVLSYYTSGTYVGKLYRATEPGGRWLQFNYGPYNGGVLVSNISASNGQSVTYNYGVFPGTTYTSLLNVVYSSDLNSAGSPCQATYTYQPDNTGAGLRPLLRTCTDAHFQGPLSAIFYEFVQSSSAVYGQILAEVDLVTGAVISSYNQSTHLETRGDGPTSFYGYYSYLITQKQDYDGNSSHFAYDANSYVNTLTNANNHVASVTCEPYTGKPTAISVTDPATGAPLTTTVSYGSTYATNPYWVAKMTGPRNDTTTFTRDGNHRITGIVYPDNTSESFSYNGFGQPLTHQRVDGSTISYTYDGAGNLTKSTDNVNSGAGLSTSYYYDSLDRLSHVVDYNNHNTWFTYNGRHLLTQREHDDGSHVDYTYDSFGNTLTASDELQHVTTASYDNHRRPLSVTAPILTSAGTSRTTTFSYETGTDTTGNANTKRSYGTMTLPSGKQIKRVYTGEGRLRSVSRGYFNGSAESDTTTDTYYYDAIGHLTQSIDANSIAQAAYTYDALERKNTLTDANGHVTSWTYYPAGSPYAGRKESKLTPGPALGDTNVTTWLAYDAAGRPLSEQDPSGNTTGKFYNSRGQLTVVSDANGDYVYAYDGLGRRSSLSFPDGTAQGWTYDPVGNLVIYKNRAGSLKTMSYDDRNRVARASWNDGVTSPISWGYDAASHVTDVNDNNAFLHFTFEDSGLTLSELATNWCANGAENTTSYTRDVDGNVTNLTYPAGDTPPYVYDHQNRCYGLNGFSEYFFQGERMIARSLGNYVSSQYAYQANNRVSEVWHAHGLYESAAPPVWPGSNISAELYGYAPDGQQTWEARQSDGGASGNSFQDGTGENYSYNGDGSINGFGYFCANTAHAANTEGDSVATAPASNPGSYANTYSYDKSGNRTAANQMGESLSYTPDGENRYSGMSYDANGDATNMTAGWTYAFNAQGQLSSTQRQGDGYTITYAYDGLGRLVYQGSSASATIFCYAGQRRIEERTASGNTSLYRYFFDSPNSDRIVFRQTSNGTPDSGPRLYYQYDAKGNTTHTPTGSHIPSVIYDEGPYSMESNAVFGQMVIGYSTGVLNSIANHTFEGTGNFNGMNGTFARATYPDGSSPALPPITIVIPGFGGGYNTPGSSNYVVHQFVGDDNVYVADRDNLAAAAQFAQNMSNLGSSVNITGYSLGATAAITLANMLASVGVEVDNLTTVDPVLLFPGSLTEPTNLINQEQNYFEHNGGIIGIVPGFLGDFGGTEVGNAHNIPEGNTKHPYMPRASLFGG